MRIQRTAVIVTFTLGILVAPFTAEAQQAGEAPQHIRTVQAFLTAWGHQRWDDLRAVAADQVMVKVGAKVFTLEPATQKSEVMLVFPFRGMSTARVEGKVTGITLEEVGLKVGESETRGPGTITLKEQNGELRVSEVSAGAPRQ